MKWCDFPENVECAKPPGTTSAPVPTEPGTKPPQTNPPETTSKPTTSKPTQPGGKIISFFSINYVLLYIIRHY